MKFLFLFFLFQLLLLRGREIEGECNECKMNAVVTVDVVCIYICRVYYSFGAQSISGWLNARQSDDRFGGDADDLTLE